MAANKEKANLSRRDTIELMAIRNDKVFNMMEAVADKSYVNISDMSQPKVEKSTKSIHNALMAAGMSPAYGNIADLADATLYALEGELGEAAWSMAAAIPIIGQMVSGRRAAKIAKDSGEKMITLYRGNRKWAPKEMVKNRRFVGPETVGGHTVSVAHKTAPSKSLFVSTDPVYAAGRAEGGFFSINAKRILKFMKKEKAYYDKHDMMIYPNNPHWNKKDFNKAIKEQMDNIASIKRQAKYENRAGQHVLEFQVPQSWVEKYGKTSDAIGGAYEGTFLFDEGLPVAFLKKVHRN